MTTTIKPIRPTSIEFENEQERQRFVNYAKTPKKTENDEGLDRMRELLKNHKPAKERK